MNSTQGALLGTGTVAAGLMTATSSVDCNGRLHSLSTTCKYFSALVGCIFISFTVSLAVQGAFQFDVVSLVYYFVQAFYFIYFGGMHSTAHGVQDLDPKQRSNLRPLQWKHRVLTTGPLGKSLTCSFFSYCFLVLSVSDPKTHSSRCQGTCSLCFLLGVLQYQVLCLSL